MKNQFKKGLLATLGMMLMLTMMSCNAKPSNDNPSNESISNDNFSEEYLLCNATSWGNMAEIESGFYYRDGSRLMYADRNNLSNWVAVCNKPDCFHEKGNNNCNAYLEAGAEIAQKDDKLYFYAQEVYPTQGHIYQVSKDGSAPIQVFKVPLNYSGEGGGRAVISQEVFLKYHKILGEGGLYTMGVYRLEEDGSMHTLFEKKYEESFGVTTLAAYLEGVRGDFVIFCSLVDKEEGYNQGLYRVDGDELERINLPEDVSVEFSYLKEDTFTYYKQNEGFFEIDLETQTETCIMKNQLSDARGYKLTDDYMIECNRYNGYMPDEAYLKFFDGSKWIDVQLPELVAKTDCYFTPTSVATDRIFFSLTKDYIPQLYYFMLNEENPTLTLATTFGNESVFEVVEPDIIHKVDVTIFDTEQYTAKLVEVGFGLAGKDQYQEDAFGMTVIFENKTDKALTMYNNNMSINGVSMKGNGVTVQPYETVERTYGWLFGNRETIDWKKKLTSFIFASWIVDDATNEQIEPMNIIKVYPYGEENIVLQERERLITDEILIDNEFIRLTAIEYWKSTDKTAEVKYYVENKTDDMIWCGASVISINGQLLNRPTDSESGSIIPILPKSYGYFIGNISEKYVENNIMYENTEVKELVGDEVKEYSVNIEVYKENVMGNESDELIFEEVVLLSPKR